MRALVRNAVMVSLGLLVWPPAVALQAQVQVFAEEEPQQVFSGEGRTLRVLIHNAGKTLFEAECHARLYQAATGTAVLLADVPWKRLQVLPGQTVVESASLDFPEVKARTRCLVQWTEGRVSTVPPGVGTSRPHVLQDSASGDETSPPPPGARVLGTTEVFVYPPDLLEALGPLARGETLGVFDPFNQLKPLLQAARLDFEDLERSGWESFGGKLALIGPFPARAQMPGELAGQIKALAQRGTAVVWLQPPRAEPEAPRPSFFTVPEGKAAVVVVQAVGLGRLAESPQAQLDLLHYARLALCPEPPRLTDLTTQP